MKNIIEILPINITEALGWTLVHSIWQSLLIFVIYQITVQFVKKSELKYNLGIGLLGLQIATSIVTYSVIFEPIAEIIYYPNLSNFSNIANTIGSEKIVSASILIKLTEWFSEKLPIFVSIWLLGMAFYLIRFGYNFWQVNQLKTKEILMPSLKTNEIFERMIAKISLQKNIKLMESTRIYSPVLIGYIKPIILLPFGLCSHLTTHEIEAIIAHELAHSRRNDYLINLIQSLIDIVYFFNPALIILSNAVRDERENCCDEYASEICGDSISIAKALVSLESFRQENILAMAFGRKGYSLKNRVQKILGISPEKANQNKVAFFAIGLIMLTIFYLNIESIAAQDQQPPKKAVSKNNIKYKDNRNYDYYEEAGKRKVIINDDKGIHFSLTQEDGKVIMNGKEYKLSPEDSSKVAYHDAEIAKLEKEIKAHSEKINKYSVEMSSYSAKINTHTDPLSKKGTEIGLMGQKIGELSQKQAKISQKLARLDEETNKKEIAELERQEKKYEEESEVIERKMEKLSEEMEALSEKMELNSAPMDSLGNLIEKESEPIEELSKKIEEHSQKMWEAYPEEVKKAYNKVMGDVGLPRPPAPPRAPRVNATPRPPMPPRAPKAPNPPKAPKFDASTGNINLETPLYAPTPIEVSISAPNITVDPVVAVDVVANVSPTVKVSPVKTEDSPTPSYSQLGYPPKARLKKKN